MESRSARRAAKKRAAQRNFQRMACAALRYSTDALQAALRQGCARLCDNRAQATVEYAAVLAGFLCVVVALGALWRAVSSGLFVEHALMAASHHIQAAALGAVADVFAF